MKWEERKVLGRGRSVCTERTLLRIYTEAWAEVDDDYGG